MRIVLYVIVAANLGGQTRPDFSGIWQLNREKSQVDPSVETAWMKIEQSASTLVVNMRVTASGHMLVGQNWDLKL